MLSNILMLIAGLGVFLFGIQTLSHNIEKLSSDKMRKEINKFSNNRFSAIGSGFLFTSFLQSSTAGITMIAGFTSAGLITLFQGFGLTLGSSMASAVPNFIIAVSSFNIKDIFCAFAVVGVFVHILSKKPFAKNIGSAIVGFSLMFVGISLMGDSTKVFSSNPAFINFFQTLTNPLILILLGIAFTIITQSSLGTIAILMTLVGSSTVTGIISVEVASFIIYGANLGASINTFFLISFSSNLDGRRIGLFHILYIALGVIIFGLLSMTNWIGYCLSWVTEPTLKIAFINLTFHLVIGLIMIPLLKPSVFIMRKILPGKKTRKNPLEIDEIQNESPSITLAKANEKILPFYDAASELYNRTTAYIYEDDISSHKKLYKDLSDYNFFINKYNMYVVRIATNEAYESVTKEIEILLNVIQQLERINRNCLKVLALLKNEDKKVVFSLKLKKYIGEIVNNSKNMLEITKRFVSDPSCRFLHGNDSNLYESVIQLSQQNSSAKLNGKTYVIQGNFSSKLSSEKNSNFIELLSYLGLMSNNILDIVFSIVGQANNSDMVKYEQLNLDEISTDQNE